MTLRPSAQFLLATVLCAFCVSFPSHGMAQEKLTACVGLRGSPSPVVFGTQLVTTSSQPLTVTISNTGGGLCYQSAGSMVVTPSAGFTVTRNTCRTLAVGQSCQADVVFTPGSEGSVTGTLRVDYSFVYLFLFSGWIDIPLGGSGERSLVPHYYQSILRRAPDGVGKVFWANEAARVGNLGASVNEVWYAMAQQFYGSPEYAAFDRDGAGFVTDLYNTFFRRAPDAGGLAFWANLLASGLPREVLLAEFMFSAEFRSFSGAIFGNPTVRAELDMVMDFYRGLLSRTPDDGGFGFWVGRFRAAQCQGAAAVTSEVETISSSFTLSGEYAGRGRTDAQYVGDLYNAFLRRGGDLAGVQFWINLIATGFRTREQVRAEFRSSPEFQARVNAVIQQGCLR